MKLSHHFHPCCNRLKLGDTVEYQGLNKIHKYIFNGFTTDYLGREAIILTSANGIKCHIPSVLADRIKKIIKATK